MKMMFCNIYTPLLHTLLLGFLSYKITTADESNFLIEDCQFRVKQGREKNLTLSNLPFPGSMVLNDTVYRRGQLLTINITGTFDGLFIRVQKTEDQILNDQLVGQFVEWPEFLVPLECGTNRNVSLVSNDISEKTDVLLTWQAPRKNMSSLEVKAYIAAKEFYWIIEIFNLKFSDFPISLEGCGKTKSCFRYASDEEACNDAICNYILTYQTVDDNQTLQFVLGGVADSNTFVGVGLTSNKELNDMHLYACIHSGGNVEVKHYFTKVNKNLTEEASLTDKKVDFYNGQMWCQFNLPLKSAKNEYIRNLQYHVYLWGPVNAASVPVLPTKMTHVSAEKISIWTPLDKYSQITITNDGSSLPAVSIVVTLAMTLFSLALVRL